MTKKFSTRSISRPGVVAAIFILPILLAVLATGCGESPGGSQYGGGVSGDTTPPVTTAVPTGGNISRGTDITFTCTDNSSGCKETWLSVEVSGNLPVFDESYTLAVSGSTTVAFIVEISGSHTIGQTYDYKFYSKDFNNNIEGTKTETYTIVP